MINGGNGPFMFPFLINQNDNNDDDGGKMPHDSYQVYVNGDYVGDHLSVAQGDGEWKAIETYLQERNFKDFKVNLEGNQISVEVEDKENMAHIRNHLEVYTQLR